MCCALALAGTALLLVAHHFHTADPFARVAFASLSLACFAVAVPVTHGLGGRLKWAISGSWSFYQPGRGGFRFVLLQTCGWASFALSVAGCAVLGAIAAQWTLAGLAMPPEPPEELLAAMGMQPAAGEKTSAAVSQGTMSIMAWCPYMQVTVLSAEVAALPLMQVSVGNEKEMECVLCRRLRCIIRHTGSTGIGHT